MRNITIRSIKKIKYNGPVYNLELKSKSDYDDLFWIEQNTGIVTHNCFSKDINAFIKTMEKNNIDPILLKAAWEQNKKVRKVWDWATIPWAVVPKEEKKL